MSLGDFFNGDTIGFTFTSISSGQPTALSSGAVQVWKSGSTTTLGTTEGITLTSTFASVAGLNHVAINLAADSTHYADGNTYDVTLGAGTVDGVSVIGYTLANFSIGLHSLTTEIADLQTSTTSIQAESTATAVVVDSIAAGTTMLSTDLDDLIATTTAIHAESTATAVVVDSIAAGTTALSTGQIASDDLLAYVQLMLRQDAAIATDRAAYLTLINQDEGSGLGSYDVTDSSQELIGATVQANLIFLADIQAGTTMLSTDADDLITTTTAIYAAVTSTGVIVSGNVTAILANSTAHGGSSAMISLDSMYIDSASNHGITIHTVSTGKHGIHINADSTSSVGINSVGSLHGIVASGGVGTAGNGFRVIAGSTGDGLFIASGTGNPISTAAVSQVAEATWVTTAAEKLIASTTSIQAGTTMLSTDHDDLLAGTTSIQAGTTMLSTDLDDLITSTTAIQAAVSSSGVVLATDSVDAAALSTDAVDEIWTKRIAELSTAMPSTPTVLDVLAFEHMSQWNKHATTSSSGYDLIYNDAGGLIFQAAVTQPTTDSMERAQYTT